MIHYNADGSIELTAYADDGSVKRTFTVPAEAT